MISASDRRIANRFLPWAVALSIAIHALLVTFAAWITIARLPWLQPRTPQRETIVASTAVRIERRVVPRERAQPKPRPAQAASAPVTPQRPARQAPPPSQPHELAREMPQATPLPQHSPSRQPPSTLQRQIAAQEQRFSQEVARLRSGDNPLSIAKRSRDAPATYRRTYFDISGHRDVDAVAVQLIPIDHWYSGSTICYYTRYVAQYTHGGSEDGTIPWPVCYPVNEDRIANPPYVHDVPIPMPPRSYVLPAGTALTPLLSRIYQTRP